jgi:general secretion pathway protein K
MKNLPQVDHPRARRTPRRSLASALMLMIWAIMLLSFTVGSTVKYIDFSLRESGWAANQFRALHLAESGAEVAFQNRVFASVDMEMPIIGTDSSITFRTEVEEAKLPLNYATDDRARESIYSIFLIWGLSAEDATTVADSLADWIDQDTEARPQGAEADYYQQFGIYNLPRQQPFASLEELLLVRGFDKVARAKPDWRNFFSIHSVGTIYIRSASKDVLMAVTGCSESDAANFISTRNGADGLARTSDDSRMSVSQAMQMLNVGGDRYSAVSAILTDDYSTRVAESIGRVGLVSVKLHLIGRRQDDGSITFLARYEE